MDFVLSNEQAMIRDTAGAVLTPAAAALDCNGDESVILDHLHELAGLGFMGLNIAPDHGGTSAGAAPSPSP